MSFVPSSHKGIVHRFYGKGVAFEHLPTSETPSNRNTLIWIGGLGDGLLTVTYPTKLAEKLPSNWCIAQALLSSSYSGWGTSSLKRDAKELARCVDYFLKQRKGSKVVLMGHSTGCQDVMEYLVGEGRETRPQISGAILQAGISDREALVQHMPAELYRSSCSLAREWVLDGRGDEIIPKSATNNTLGAPVTAYRWLSLAAKGGDDDYFSSDLDDQQLKKTFGALKPETPVMFLLSGCDEHMPDFVDKDALIARWTSVIKEAGGAVDEEHGGVVEDAFHNLEGDPDEVVEDLIRRVNGFLMKIDSGDRKDSSNL
ncbi:hypothetical protein H2199_006660 [Coniosporium tulheliwenetii]|uniref:Uncharacterized protein n=1 Tax=Coniosporium tulheliwenetii TaxID=3383036 RepID=A0ACC2YU73_9PEZI|nr:hypothetical protein H2199_006660 [Cladosporium sp. JES 115]